MPLGPAIFQLLALFRSADVNATALVLAGDSSSPVAPPQCSYSQQETDVNITNYTYPIAFWYGVGWGLTWSIVWALFAWLAMERRVALKRAENEKEFNLRTSGQKVVLTRTLSRWVNDKKYEGIPTKLSTRHQLGALNQCVSELVIAIGSETMFYIVLLNLAGSLLYAYMMIDVESRINEHTKQSNWGMFSGWIHATGYDILYKMFTGAVISGIWAFGTPIIIAVTGMTGVVSLPCCCCCLSQRRKLKSREKEMADQHAKINEQDKQIGELKRQLTKDTLDKAHVREAFNPPWPEPTGAAAGTPRAFCPPDEDVIGAFRAGMGELDSAASRVSRTFSSSIGRDTFLSLERARSWAASRSNGFARSLTPTPMSSGAREYNGVGRALTCAPTSDELRVRSILARAHSGTRVYVGLGRASTRAPTSDEIRSRSVLAPSAPDREDA